MLSCECVIVRCKIQRAKEAQRQPKSTGLALVRFATGRLPENSQLGANDDSQAWTGQRLATRNSVEQGLPKIREPHPALSWHPILEIIPVSRTANQAKRPCGARGHCHSARELTDALVRRRSRSCCNWQRRESSTSDVWVCSPL